MIYLHPNLELKLYEPVNPLKPWTLNNRLHDKAIISDKKIAIIGGRNIGDRFFAPDSYTKEITYDRDIIIVNTEQENPDSGLHEISAYFDMVWNHYCSKLLKKPLFPPNENKITQNSIELLKELEEAREKNLQIIPQDIDFMEISLPTKKFPL